MKRIIFAIVLLAAICGGALGSYLALKATCSPAFVVLGFMLVCIVPAGIVNLCERLEDYYG